MCLSNIAEIRAGFETADEIYKRALDADPIDVSNALLIYAEQEPIAEKRDMMRMAASLILQQVVRS